MRSTNDGTIEVVDGKSSRDLFPGYYAPTEVHRREAFERGLVTLDANALLDLYRFTPKARQEFIESLVAMKSRLFLTHQAALEFHRSRLKVHDDRVEGTAKESGEIAEALRQVGEKVNGFARRYQIADSERNRLQQEVSRLAKDVEESLRKASEYDLNRGDVRLAVDAVVRQFDDLFAGRIGDAMTSDAYNQALVEAVRRRKERIPPGYMDEKSGNVERQAGDYLVWRQLLDAAKAHNRPILFVCNEDKEDWVVKYRGETLGPRPELTLELQQEAGVFLYMVNVPAFLFNARNYLGTAVSDSTLAEAESIPDDLEVVLMITREASEQFKALRQAEQARLRTILVEVKDSIRTGRPMPPGVKRAVRKSTEDLDTPYIVRIDNLKARILVQERSTDDGERLLVVVVIVRVFARVRGVPEAIEAT